MSNFKVYNTEEQLIILDSLKEANVLNEKDAKEIYRIPGHDNRQRQENYPQSLELVSIRNVSKKPVESRLERRWNHLRVTRTSVSLRV